MLRLELPKNQRSREIQSWRFGESRFPLGVFKQGESKVNPGPSRNGRSSVWHVCVKYFGLRRSVWILDDSGQHSTGGCTYPLLIALGFPGYPLYKSYMLLWGRGVLTSAHLWGSFNQGVNPNTPRNMFARSRPAGMLQTTKRTKPGRKLVSGLHKLQRELIRMPWKQSLPERNQMGWFPFGIPFKWVPH